MDDIPLPEHSPPPRRRWQLLEAFVQLIGSVILITVKVIACLIVFFIALIFALAWRN